MLKTHAATNLKDSLRTNVGGRLRFMHFVGFALRHQHHRRRRSVLFIQGTEERLAKVVAMKQ